jgi:hypothetical protein
MTGKHMAWLRFKEGISAERIDQHMAACRALPEKVPALIALECGASFASQIVPAASRTASL